MFELVELEEKLISTSKNISIYYIQLTQELQNKSLKAKLL